MNQKTEVEMKIKGLSLIIREKQLEKEIIDFKIEEFKQRIKDYKEDLEKIPR